MRLNLFNRVRKLWASWLFRLAQSNVGAVIVGYSFQYFHYFLPVSRIINDKLVLVFQHPRPLHPMHILLVPKKAVRTIRTLRAEDSQFFTRVFFLAKEIVGKLDDRSYYYLVVNGGARQETQQVHFHLLGERSKVNPLASLPTDVVFQESFISAFRHPTPNCQTHIVILFKKPALPLSELSDDFSEVAYPLLTVVAKLVASFDLETIGYSLLTQEVSQLEQTRLVFHVVGGGTQH